MSKNKNTNNTPSSNCESRSPEEIRTALFKRYSFPIVFLGTLLGIGPWLLDQYLQTGEISLKAIYIAGPSFIFAFLISFSLVRHGINKRESDFKKVVTKHDPSQDG